MRYPISPYIPFKGLCRAQESEGHTRDARDRMTHAGIYIYIYIYMNAYIYMYISIYIYIY